MILDKQFYIVVVTKDPPGKIQKGSFFIYSLLEVIVMPRGNLTKVDALARIYKIKNQVYNRQGRYEKYKELELDAANQTLNDVLNIIEEYSQ